MGNLDVACEWLYSPFCGIEILAFEVLIEKNSDNRARSNGRVSWTGVEGVERHGS